MVFWHIANAFYFLILLRMEIVGVANISDRDKVSSMCTKVGISATVVAYERCIKAIRRA